MDLSRLLPTTHVMTNFSADSRRNIFTALAKPLVEDALITDPHQFIHDLEERESQITTQLDKGIAIPHARSHAVRRLALSVGISNGAGLVFNESLPEPCRVFFLIAIPAFAPTAHLPLLQHLASLAKSDKHLNKLLAAKTPAQAARAIIGFKA